MPLSSHSALAPGTDVLEGVAALVLHGFTGVPPTVAPLAEALEAAGAIVAVPLLAGHGAGTGALVATGYRDWLGTARSGLSELRLSGRRLVVCGLSMGGTLALELGATEDDLAGIVLVNPLVEPPAPSLLDLFDRLAAAGVETVPFAGADLKRADLDYTGATEAPLAPLRSLLEALSDLAGRLGSITAPIVCFSSAVDHVVPPTTGAFLEASVTAAFEQVVLDESFHLATLDGDADRIARETVAFAAEWRGVAR